ncbi:NADH-quinone oxidoreductase subunit J family protein [Campylobacter hyointestinalis]|uniref:NADH-quinone oxidoreductase subunit J n=1 Tax=Campylobacter hyointestinalis subsp. hyointestinalis TaxID=91352 RepID=A0A9W5ET14_CAMHY|nr:NADH-quinone oxidoreductase subunit J [Campylobacter hyointestinalis]MBT0612118.1 NADH-quinone oxidoreductase subunit J [Campylobacter hyointestinalis subsp. hyointestinalis]MDY2998539.1 NADH-quinone oxidoreductase subunit J [Campylobacter hyointestinalis]PPB56504.1 NADH-quinone oxidoreductase [Campylobacter hyointestinalis subsp. hyointestinalis]PPB67951.1 NADH-quinone oxidoreductase [Campylobacter hyointestinalis subsp. hyointestinalis]PPB73755.1 NADH-quinone oxidoreductase [Campylobacter
MELFLFINFSLLAILGSLGLLFFKAPIHSALSLIVTLVCIAGLYLLLNAKTLFLIQIVVYAGAIMVLSIFVVMFFNIQSDFLIKRFSKKSLLLATPIIILFVIFASLVLGLNPELGVANEGFGEIKPLGFYLFSNWALSFEAISILLTAALIAVVTILKGKNDA